MKPKHPVSAFRTAWVGALAIFLASCGQRDVPLSQFNKIGDFQLIDSTGRVVSNADVKGRILVVDFFFGSCSAQCLTLSQRMEELQRLTAGTRDLMLLSITVDPRTDTPEALQRYAGRHNADTNRWLFLTGDRSVIYPFIQQSFLLTVAADNDLGAPFGGGFIHSTKIALVDKRGVVRAYYEGMDGSAPQQILSGIEQLRKEPPSDSQAQPVSETTNRTPL